MLGCCMFAGIAEWKCCCFLCSRKMSLMSRYLSTVAGFLQRRRILSCPMMLLRSARCKQNKYVSLRVDEELGGPLGYTFRGTAATSTASNTILS